LWACTVRDPTRLRALRAGRDRRVLLSIVARDPPPGLDGDGLW
jgi:hypothetical protein